jgi:thiamine monophosphate kinase
MDLSDGLADAVRQIAEASQVGVTLDAGALPISDAVRRWHEARDRRLLLSTDGHERPLPEGFQHFR